MSTTGEDTSERSHRRRTMTVIVVALAVLASVGLAVKQLIGAEGDAERGAAAEATTRAVTAEGADAPVGPDGSPAPGGGVMEPGTSDTDPARIVYTTPPLGPIPGIGIEAVVSAWEKRWKVTLKSSPETRERSTIVDYPLGGGRLHLAFRTTAGGAEMESVVCILDHGTKKVDRKVQDGIVNDCLFAALEQSERAEAIAWLNAQDYQGKVDFQTQRKSMTRFDLTLKAMPGAAAVSVEGRP